MIEIRNSLFQPLTFQLAGEKRGLHLGPRQRKTIDDAQVSDEMRTAEKGEFIVLTVLEQADQPETQPESSAPADNSSENTEPSDGPATSEPAQVTNEATTLSEDSSSSANMEITAQSEPIADETSSKKRR